MDEAQSRQAGIAAADLHDEHAIDLELGRLAFVPRQEGDLVLAPGEPLREHGRLAFDAAHVPAGATGHGPIGEMRNDADLHRRPR